MPQAQARPARPMASRGAPEPPRDPTESAASSGVPSDSCGRGAREHKQAKTHQNEEHNVKGRAGRTNAAGTGTVGHKPRAAGDSTTAMRHTASGEHACRGTVYSETARMARPQGTRAATHRHKELGVLTGRGQAHNPQRRDRGVARRSAPRRGSSAAGVVAHAPAVSWLGMPRTRRQPSTSTMHTLHVTASPTGRRPLTVGREHALRAAASAAWREDAAVDDAAMQRAAVCGVGRERTGERGGSCGSWRNDALRRHMPRADVIAAAPGEGGLTIARTERTCAGWGWHGWRPGVSGVPRVPASESEAVPPRQHPLDGQQAQNAKRTCIPISSPHMHAHVPPMDGIDRMAHTTREMAVPPAKARVGIECPTHVRRARNGWRGSNPFPFLPSPRRQKRTASDAARRCQVRQDPHQDR